MPKSSVAITIGLAGVVVVSSLFPAAAQKKGSKRPLTTKQLMAGLVKPQLTALQESLKAGPETDEDWAKVATTVNLLNESGYLMMDDERCPDAIWSKGCAQLRDATQTLLADVRQRNAASALEHVSLVTQSCKTCHTEHKYKKK